MKILNLTPHPARIGGVDYPAAATPARCREELIPGGTLAGVPLVKKTLGAVEGLPPPEPGVLFFVSALVAQAAWAAGRTDVVCPGEVERDAAGRVVGCVSLAVAP